MKKIKNNYTNFILTVIAVALMGILFKGEIIKPAHAVATISGLANGHLTIADNQMKLFKQHQKILANCN